MFPKVFPKVYRFPKVFHDGLSVAGAAFWSQCAGVACSLVRRDEQFRAFEKQNPAGYFP